MNRQNIYLLVLVFALLAPLLTSCHDDDFAFAPSPESDETRVTPLKVEHPGGLIQQADGSWLSQNCRVPIVGPGRMVNEINSATVSVIGTTGKKLAGIVDENLDDACVIRQEVLSVDLASPIVSVKDLYHIYAPNQKVGFVYQDDTGGGSLLSLDLLKGMTLTTYLRGREQEKFRAATGSGESEVLHLDLITINNKDGQADRVVAMNATKPFDEVKLSFSGVKLEAGISVAIKYAFVGENPEIKAIEGEPYWGTNPPFINNDDWDGLAKMTDIVGNSEKYIVDKDIESNFGDINSGALGVAASHRATVNFNREIPAGTEVGYRYTAGELLGLAVLNGNKGPALYTYNEKNKEVERYVTKDGVVNVGLLQGAKNATISMVTTEPCCQLMIVRPSKGVLIPGLLDISTLHVYYAYIRNKVITDPANYFTFGNDTTYNQAYQLPEPEKGTVQYVLLSQPYGAQATVSGKLLIGMTHEGAYRVQALYTAPDGRQVSHIATIYHRKVTKQTNCYNLITSASHEAYASEALGWKGCLLCLFNGSNNLNNVVDRTLDNYASLNQVLSLVGKKPVASFSMNKPVTPAAGKKIRTGFVVQAHNGLLDLDAVKWFEVRLYRNGQRVGQGDVAGAESVDVGLIGHESDKLRLSIETDQEFDRIELWNTEVAGLLSSLRLYHVFYEDASCNEAAGMGGCMELLTNLKDGLEINFEKTFLEGIANVGQSFSDLDYLIDGSMETGAFLGKGVSLGGSIISVKFKEQPANQVVGLLFKGLPNLADVKLAELGILQAFKGDTPLDKTAEGELLAADLLSQAGYTYFELQVKQPFDRLDYTVGGLKVGEAAQLCGVYIRPDADGDGIPDCSDTKDVGQLEVEKKVYHTCFGNPFAFPLTSVVPQGLQELDVYAYDLDTQENVRCKARIEEGQAGKEIQLEGGALPVGRYKLYFYSLEGDLLAYDVEAVVHPLQTTWNKYAATTDWNAWENWTEGSPWTCTDVILPEGAMRYPELKTDVDNYCDDIHFESGAELVYTHRLKMGGKVYADLRLTGGRSYLVSAPLKETYTGDWFISPGLQWGKSQYFEPITQTNYPEHRMSPVVYQRLWSRTATERVIGENGNLQDEPVEVETTQWTRPFNAVATPYELGQGLSLRAGEVTDFNAYTFHFPKEHDKYTYFYADGTSTGKTDQVKRKGTDIGTFAQGTPGPVKLTNQGGSTFLMGNPYLTHLDVQAFLQANQEVSHILLYDGNQANSLILVDGQLVSSQTQADLLIAPMEAFFVVAKSVTKELNVTLNEAMLRQKQVAPAVRLTANQLKLTAAVGSHRSSCVLLQSTRAADVYRHGEDVELLIDDEVRPQVALFSVSEGKALTIQQVKSATRIALGLLVNQARDVQLTFEQVGSQWKNWMLEDTASGTLYPLQGTVTLNGITNGAGRFRLVRHVN